MAAGVVIVAAAAVGVNLSREPAPAEVGRVSRERWRRPSGSPEEMADAMTLSELIDRWEAVPRDRSLFGLHADYAAAIALWGADAWEAVPALAPYAESPDPTLRKAALAALAAIGIDGLPALLDALAHASDDVRSDAAAAIAGMDPVPEEAVPALAERLLDFEESVPVRQEAARALAGAEGEAAAVLARAREAYYARSGAEGLSPGEVGVLRAINLALQGGAQAGAMGGDDAEEE